MIYLVRVFIITYLFVFNICYSQESIKIIYYDSYKPYSWKNSEGKMEGIWVDVFDEIIKKEMGIDIEHIGYPWSRAQYLLKKGEADALIGMNTEGRRLYLDFNKIPVYTSKMTIFSSKKNSRIKAIKTIKKVEDLDKFSLIDIVGNRWSATKFSYLNIEYVRNLDNVFKMLVSGRSDIFLSDSMAANYFIKDHGFSKDIIEIPFALDKVESYFGIRKDSGYRYILDDFDILFSKFKEKGGMDKILQKYGKEY